LADDGERRIEKQKAKQQQKELVPLKTHENFLKKQMSASSSAAASSSLSELEPGALGSPAPGGRRTGHLTNQRRVESTHHGSSVVEDNEPSCMILRWTCLNWFFFFF
jgi:hypothetical protein